MSVAVTRDDIGVDKCFRTPSNEVRHVSDVADDGQITFTSRGSQYIKPPPWERRPRQAIEKFISEVVEAVPVHWDPRFQPLKGPTV